MPKQNIFSKEELETIILAFNKFQEYFLNSKELIKLGKNRNQKMNNDIKSYSNIFGYYYEKVFQYGKYSSLVDDDTIKYSSWEWVILADVSNRKSAVHSLAECWSDVLQVFYSLELASESEREIIAGFSSDIDLATEAMERFSGQKCLRPKRNMYNPYAITENIGMSQGHYVPDLSFVYAKELLPQLLTAKVLGQDKKEVIANYTISLIKSYFENAGYVPMKIVDAIIGPIDKIVNRTENIDYSPFKTLKEYVLGKIYR